MFGIGSPEGGGVNPGNIPIDAWYISRPERPSIPFSPAQAERVHSPSDAENALDSPGSTHAETPLEPEKSSASIDLSGTSELSRGNLDGESVTVRVTKLGPDTREVIISAASGLQVGERNRQLNSHHYEVVKPEVSIDRFFEDHPDLQRSFERLAANPGNAIANYLFRQRLSGESLYAGGRVRRVDTSGSGHVRFSVRVDNRLLRVVKSQGAQLGRGNIQRNEFFYQVKRPELHLGAVLRDRPDLVRRLAMAAKYPNNRLVRDSFTQGLTAAVGKVSGKVTRLSDGYGGAIVRSQGGEGVQLGKWNIRVDKVGFHAAKVTLAHWEGSDLPGSEAGVTQLSRVIQAGHLRRIAESRPHGFVAQHSRQVPANLLHHCIARAAAAALDQIAPGRRHLAADMAKEIAAALGDPEQRRRQSRWRGGMASAEVGILYQDSSRDAGSTRRSAGKQATSPPHVELIDLADQERRPRHSSGAETVPGSLEGIDVARGPGPAQSRSELHGTSSGSETGAASGRLASLSASGATGRGEESVTFPAAQAPTEPARTAGSSAGPFATGAVICGSAAAIGKAMGTRILDADVMLAYVRRRVWDDRYDGKHHSVMSALRAVQNLQVVVFLDPFQGQGLWIDVDPARQVPAAWLLIEMDLSAGLPGRFRFFRLQESVSP